MLNHKTTLIKIKFNMNIRIQTPIIINNQKVILNNNNKEKILDVSLKIRTRIIHNNSMYKLFITINILYSFKVIIKMEKCKILKV